jgi:hypothetical protein
MSSEIIQSIVCDNYNDFQHVNFIFSQNFISLFWGLFNDETDLWVRYLSFVESMQKFLEIVFWTTKSSHSTKFCENISLLKAEPIY